MLSERVRPDIEAAPWVVNEIKQLENEIERLNTGIKAAYATLQMYGVPELRAKSVASGIMVLVSRMGKEANFQAHKIARLQEALKEIVAMGERDSNFPQDGRMYDIAKVALEI